MILGLGINFFGQTKRPINGLYLEITCLNPTRRRPKDEFRFGQGLP